MHFLDKMLPPKDHEFEAKIETVLVKSTLSQNASFLVLERLSVIYKTGEYTDLFFHCQDGTVSSHKVVLAGLSDHLKNLFLVCGQEEAHVYLPEIKLSQMKQFLRKVYLGGEGLLEDFVDVVDILKVFRTCEPMVLNKTEVQNHDFSKPISLDKSYSMEIFPCIKEEPYEEEIPLNDDNDDNHKANYNESEDDESENDDPSWTQNGPKKIKTPKKPRDELDKPKSKRPYFKNSKKPSMVWKYFQKTKELVTCNTCNLQFKNNGNTTNASVHLKKHPEVYSQFIEEVQKQKEQTDEDFFGDEKIEPKMEESTKLFRPKRSAIWEHFKAVTDPDGVQLGQCNYCGQMITNNCGSTSAMIGHLKSKHGQCERNEDGTKVSRRKRSLIWDHFKSIQEPGLEGNKGKCNYCNHIMRNKFGSTSAMILHLKTKHLSEAESYIAKTAEQEEKVDEENGDDKDVDSDKIEQLLTESGMVVGKNGKIGKKRGRKINLMKNAPETRTCVECDKVFSTRASMLYHYRTSEKHSSEKPFTCEFCGKAFARKDSYESHKTSHDAVLPFMCAYCGNTYAKKHRRDVHERSHTGDYRFSCSYCPKQFTCKQKKVCHERIHTGEKPYPCTNCGRRFAKSSQLATHFRIHTGEKPYHCQKCVQNFRHLSSYRNHRCVDPTNTISNLPEKML